MKLQDIPFMTTNWSEVPSTNHPGQSGLATWKTLEVGNVRVRIVEYSSGYLADHWCSRGHVLLVLEGELVTELKDKRRFTLSTNMSYQVTDKTEPHQSSTSIGAKLFIVD